MEVEGKYTIEIQPNIGDMTIEEKRSAYALLIGKLNVKRLDFAQIFDVSKATMSKWSSRLAENPNLVDGRKSNSSERK